LSFDLYDWGDIYARFGDRNNRVDSGEATTPLNDMSSLEMGTRIHFPLPRGWNIGGSYRWAQRKGSISPQEANSFSIQLKSRRFLGTSARLGLRKSIVDYDNSPEDLDVVSYTFGLTSLLPGRVQIAYDAEYREDTGGTYFREDLRHTIRLYWRYRLVTFSLHASQADISQDEFGRDTTRITAHLRRQFR
jgi:hypothetical protein